MTPLTVRCYAAAIASAKIGTGFFFLINTWLVIELTGRPASGAVALVVTILPSLLLSPLIGLVVDRSQPARLAYRAELLRWLTLVFYAALYGAGLASEGLAYAVGFCIALGNEVQLLAWRAALTRSVPAGQLLRLNALTVIGGQTGQILGAAASGIVLAMAGAVPTLALTGTTYLVSAGFGALVSRRLGLAKPAAATGGRGLGRHFRELRAGIAHILQRPEISFFYLLILANLTVIFGINAMLAPFVREELRLGPDAFGKIDAGYALGAILGGLVVVRLARWIGRLRILLLGFLLMAASLFAFAQCQGLVTAFILYAGLGISFQTSALSLSLAQQATDPAFQGRVNAAFNMLNGLAGLIIYSVVAASAGHHLYRPLYLVQAALMLAIIPMLLLARRHRRIAALLAPAPDRDAAHTASAQHAPQLGGQPS